MSEYKKILKHLAEITDHLEIMDEGIHDSIGEAFGRLHTEMTREIKDEFSDLSEHVGQMVCHWAEEMAGFSLEYVSETIQENISEVINDKLEDLGKGDDRLLTHHLEDLKSDLSGVAVDAAAQLKQLQRLKSPGPVKIRTGGKVPLRQLPAKRGPTAGLQTTRLPKTNRKPMVTRV